MMQSKTQLDWLPDGIVYLKPVEIEDLPPEVQERVGDHTKLFSVHDSNGRSIALVDTAELAFELAEQYQVRAVHVH